MAGTNSFSKARESWANDLNDRANTTLGKSSYGLIH